MENRSRLPARALSALGQDAKDDAHAKESTDQTRRRPLT